MYLLLFGFVVQDFALIDRYTVRKNVSIPLTYSHKNFSSKSNRVDDVLRQLKIFEKKKVIASNLSGGQRQRVAIARAIINEPEIILADEPTGALDKKTGKEVLSIFRELNKQGKTIIIVTHDMNVANECQRVIRIEDGKLAE